MYFHKILKSIICHNTYCGEIMLSKQTRIVLSSFYKILDKSTVAKCSEWFMFAYVCFLTFLSPCFLIYKFPTILSKFINWKSQAFCGRCLAHPESVCWTKWWAAEPTLKSLTTEYIEDVSLHVYQDVHFNLSVNPLRYFCTEGWFCYIHKGTDKETSGLLMAIARFE